MEEHVGNKAPLSEKFFVVLDEETEYSGQTCIIVENLVERRRRFTKKRLSPDPGYEGDDKVKHAREDLGKAVQTLVALDISQINIQEL